MSGVYGSTTIYDLHIELLVHVFLDVTSYDVANIAENPEKLSHAPPVVPSHLWTLVVLSQEACRTKGEGSPVDLIYCPNPVHTTVSGEMVVMHSLLSDVSFRRIRSLIARYAWGANFPPQTPARHGHLRTMRSRARRRHRGVVRSPPWEKHCHRSRPMILQLWVPGTMPRQTRACRLTLPRRPLMDSKPSG
ncbi:hypothetical protein FB107DRAFT_288046 [Schizophyllum commune]